MPEGWCWSTLGELCTVFSAKRVHQSDWQKDGIPFYRAREIVKLSEQGYVENDLFISEKLYNEFTSTGLIPGPGDIMISAVGTIGKTYIVRATDRFYFKDASVLCLKNPHLVPAYLDLYLMSTLARTQMQYGSKGTTVDTITIEKAADYIIPIPPFAEQKRIVSYLNSLLSLLVSIESQKVRIDNLIDRAKNRILNLAINGKLVPQDPADEPAIELLKRINPAFKASDNLHYEGDLPKGWCLTHLEDVALYGDTSNVDVSSINSDSWILELEDIEKDTGKIIDIRVKAEREVCGVRHSFKKGQILYSKLRTYLNKVLITPDDGFCTTEIVPITACNAILSDYLLMVMRSPYFLEYTMSCCYGVKMPRLGTNDAKKAIIPLPPLAEQLRIVEKASELLTIISTLIMPPLFD